MRGFCQLCELHRFVCNVGARSAIAVVALLAGGSGLALSPIALAADADVFYLKDVEKGQRGYGLSVFSGSEIERFDFEVLGVWHNVQPGTSYVLARLEGQGLDKSGVIAGMSGSPVYLDGRLLGAVSFGWPFSNEAIAGITPVEHMRTMLAQPVGPSASVSASASTNSGHLVRGEIAEANFRASLALLRPQTIGEASVAIEWATAGFGGEVRSLLSKALGPVAAAGGAMSSPASNPGSPVSPESKPDLRPGSAVAAILIDGDLRLAATGTVTDRVGESILAFGHPFLGIGPIAVPMATAEILTVVSSQWTSFKVANLGPVVGAIDFDFLTGIRGELGGVAPVVPMEIHLGAREPVRVSLARIPSLTPTLAAISLLGALGAETETAGAESIDLEFQLDLGVDGLLSMTQSFDGQQAPLAAAIHLYAVTGYLVQTRLAEVDLRSLEVNVTPHPAPRTMTLVGAHPSRSVVRPGDTVRLNVDLAEYRGARVRRELDVEVPSNLSEGRYVLLVGDGLSLDAVRLGIEQTEPETLAQALAFLESLHSKRELRVLGIVEEPGMSLSGEVFPDLPGSIRSLWGASGGGDARLLRMSVAVEVGLTLEQPVEGLLRVDLQVERAQPVVGDDGAAGAAGTGGGGESGDDSGAGEDGGSRSAAESGVDADAGEDERNDDGVNE